MKVKYSVVPFIPAFLAMMFLELMSLLGVDSKGEFMGMNSLNITYVVVGIAAGLFVICLLFNLLDRKTAPAYPVKKNGLAGLLSIVAGVAVFPIWLIPKISSLLLYARRFLFLRD